MREGAIEPTPEAREAACTSRKKSQSHPFSASKYSRSSISNKYDMAEGCTSEDRCFSLESVRCLGACGLAPVMVIGEDVHGAVKADTVLEILQRYE